MSSIWKGKGSSARRVCAAALALSCVVQPATAELLTANQLVEYAEAYQRVTGSRGRTNDGVHAGMFMGYVAGASDAILNVHFCPPEATTLGQYASIVHKAMRERPELLHHSADTFVAVALGVAFPCADRRNGREI